MVGKSQDIGEGPASKPEDSRSRKESTPTSCLWSSNTHHGTSVWCTHVHPQINYTDKGIKIVGGCNVWSLAYHAQNPRFQENGEHSNNFKVEFTHLKNILNNAVMQHHTYISKDVCFHFSWANI